MMHPRQESPEAGGSRRFSDFPVTMDGDEFANIPENSHYAGTRPPKNARNFAKVDRDLR